MALQKFLGVTTLKGKSGDLPVPNLEGKTLLLYFSAHWCPPCRQFTPVLAKFYRDLKAKRSDFELVFVSSDRSEEQFDEYFKEHPWLAIPFSERKAAEKLNRKCKVQGIPMLAVVDKDGALVTTAARNNVMQDPEGKKFPWIPRKAFEILADTVITAKDGSVLTIADLSKLDAVALYFSAHWCPPCRAFTPRLVSVYNALKRRGVKMEFVFVSSDREEGQFDEYYGEMPWARLPFQDERVRELKELCGVEGIPTLVTIGGDGKIINKDARGAAAEDAEGTQFPWKPVELGSCTPFHSNDAVVEALNSDICVILHSNGAANKETAKVEFTKAATLFAEGKRKGDGDGDGDGDAQVQVRFFISDSAEGDELYSRVAQVVGASVASPGVSTVLAINLPNNRAKAMMTGEISATTVSKFATDFHQAQTKE